MHDVAIIGFGKMGRMRNSILDAIPGCSVKWLCDVVPVAGDSRFTNDPEVIFRDPEVDIVFVCVPNCFSKDLVVRGLDSRKHVFCEKPCGTSAAQILEIIEAERRNPGCKLMIGFNHRRHRSVIEAKRLVDSGEFGKILWMRGRYGKSVDEDFFSTWRAKKAYAGGGILLDQGSHLLDLFLMFCDDFEEVKAFCSNLYWHLDIEDNVFAILKNSRGQVASLHSTMTQWRHLFAFEIFMERGYIVINGLVTPSKTYGKEELSVALNRSMPPRAVWTKEEKLVFSVDDSFEEEIKAFLDCIDSDSPVTTGNGQDALKVMRLVERIYGGK